MMRNRRDWDETQSSQWKYFLENERKERKEKESRH